MTDPNPSTSAPLPCVVLVRPQLGANIGKAARAMLNFGLLDLRLVAPRDGWPNPDAGPAASGADSVLDGVQVFDTLADAVHDCTQLFASTVRRRDIVKPVLTPEAMATAVHATSGRSALIFGPERSGLESDDVAKAHAIVTVPIHPGFGSLNLAQAVILLAYEWSKGRSGNLVSPPATELDPPAPHRDVDGLVQAFDAELDARGYFFPPDRVVATRRSLRSLLTKANWSAKEVQMMRGILRQLTLFGPDGTRF